MEKEQRKIRKWKIIKNKKWEWREKIKWGKKRRKHTKKSNPNRSPQIRFLGYKDKNLSPARALYRHFCNSITMVLYEVRARNWPVTAEDELQRFSQFLVSRWKQNVLGGPQRAFCLYGILKTRRCVIECSFGRWVRSMGLVLYFQKSLRQDIFPLPQPRNDAALRESRLECVLN